MVIAASSNLPLYHRKRVRGHHNLDRQVGRDNRLYAYTTDAAD